MDRALDVVVVGVRGPLCTTAWPFVAYAAAAVARTHNPAGALIAAAGPPDAAAVSLPSDVENARARRVAVATADARPGDVEISGSPAHGSAA
jgi:hypothetical protein